MAPPSPSTLTSTVLNIVTTKFDAAGDTTAESSYQDMALDSLALVELAVHLSKLFTVNIAADEIADSETVGATAELLASKGVVG